MTKPKQVIRNFSFGAKYRIQVLPNGEEKVIACIHRGATPSQEDIELLLTHGVLHYQGRPHALFNKKGGWVHWTKKLKKLKCSKINLD